MTTQAKGISAKEVSELRKRTGAGMMDCKKALEATNGDMDAAVEFLRKSGAMKAEKRVGRAASEGLIGTYIHHNGKLGVMVEVNCETDFVARTDDFKNLVKSIAEHIAGTPTPPIAVDKDQIPADKVENERRIFSEQVKESGKPAHLVDKIVEGKIEAFYKEVSLLNQLWVRDDKKTIGELVKEVSGKTGENIQVKRFVRFQMGEG
jgi:elongation factor Ts